MNDAHSKLDIRRKGMSAIKWKVGGSSSQEANISWLSWLYSTPPSGGLWYINNLVAEEWRVFPNNNSKRTFFSSSQEWHCALACRSVLRMIRVHFLIDKAPEEMETHFETFYMSTTTDKVKRSVQSPHSCFRELLPSPNSSPTLTCEKHHTCG